MTLYETALANFRSGAYGTPEAPRTGATHRAAFWAGYFGRSYPGLVRGSIAEAHHRAGRDARKAA